MLVLFDHGTPKGLALALPGHTVHTVYECCGFGYTFHEELCAAGAQSLVTTPMRLNLERRRKNDRMDATELCVRLSRYLDRRVERCSALQLVWQPIMG